MDLTLAQKAAVNCQFAITRNRCEKAGGPYTFCACEDLMGRAVAKRAAAHQNSAVGRVEAAQAEVADIHDTFLRMLAPCSGDGQVKRAAGKPHWHIDPGHEAALRRHLARWELDRGGVDDTSGASHLAHAAWRALALAWQEGYRP